MTNPESTSSSETYRLSNLAIPLLKGVVYRADDALLWNALLSLQAAVRDYFAVLGLALELDEAACAQRPGWPHRFLSNFPAHPGDLPPLSTNRRQAQSP